MRHLGAFLLAATAFTVPASLLAQDDLPPDKLIVLVRSDGCDFAALSARLGKAGRTLARDRRTSRVILDRPADPEKNLDMLGKPSAIVAAIEVSALRADLEALDLKVRRKLGAACTADSYLVHERRLMTLPRTWMPGEPSPATKALTTLVRRHGVSSAEFVSEWAGVHAEMSLGWRKARGGDSHYVQNIVVRTLGDGSPWLDGIGEIEGPRSGGVGEAERAARMETAAHARTFQNMDDIQMFVAREVILKD